MQSNSKLYIATSLPLVMLAIQGPVNPRSRLSSPFPMAAPHFQTKTLMQTSNSVCNICGWNGNKFERFVDSVPF